VCCCRKDKALESQTREKLAEVESRLEQLQREERKLQAVTMYMCCVLVHVLCAGTSRGHYCVASSDVNTEMSI